MGKKPSNSELVTVHTYWDSFNAFLCPICGHHLEYAYNDGGRLLITLDKPLWIVSNYYRCTHLGCTLHKAFPIIHENVLFKKKFGKDVWEQVINFHFNRHLDYEQIRGVIWDVYKILISITSIREICLYFKTAGKLYTDEETLEEIRKNGEMVLSLDGAQPKKGYPALWLFTDRITGRVLLSELMKTAPAILLAEKMKKIQSKYKVPIRAVISDKQKNIVNAVKQFNPEIPHAYCQYHFLNHIMEPIVAKDSHIATQLKKEIRKYAIIVNQYKGTLNSNNPEFNPHYKIFYPLAEEFLNAISVKRKRWDVLPGIEIYKNLGYIFNKLGQLPAPTEPKKRNALSSIIERTQDLLNKYSNYVEEINYLLKDTADLRIILSKDRFKAKNIEGKVRIWVYRFQQRLKRTQMDYKPENLKYVQMDYNTSLNIIWQQWVRLEHSYNPGLYLTYDSPIIEKTNNATERLINQTKYHFRKWLGKRDISDGFQRHGAEYSVLAENGIKRAEIKEVLWKFDIAYISGLNLQHQAIQATIRRRWNIRDENTGNLERLADNLQV
ncbi:MAG: hypothetical protein ACTSWL_01350 [Promethearchaeota archaeon]